MSNNNASRALAACSIALIACTTACAGGDAGMNADQSDFGFAGDDGADEGDAGSGGPMSDVPAEEGIPVCGDGILEGLEQCDDGNTISGDGCDADCGSALHITWEDEISGDPGTDTALAVAPLAEGGWIMAGQLVNGDKPDGFARRYLLGDFETWLQMWQGPASGTDVFRDIACDKNGFCYAVGQTNYGDGQGTNMLIVKYAEDGTELWADAPDLGAGGTDTAYTVEVAENGDVLVAGYGRRVVDTPNDGFVRRYNATGTVLWTEYFDGADAGKDAVYAIETLANDEYLLAGYQSKQGQGLDAWVARIDGDGNVLNTPRTFNGRFGGDDIVRDVVHDDGGVLIVGYERDADGEPYTFARRYDLDLNPVWKHEFGHGAAFSIVPLSNGNVVAVGHSTPDGEEFPRPWAAKLHVDDELIWEKTVDLESTGHAEFVDAMYDAEHGELLAVGGVTRLDDPRNVWVGRLTL